MIAHLKILLNVGAIVTIAVAVGVSDEARAANKHACTIIIGDEGILKPSVDLTVLSSKGTGGRAAEVTITATNSSYSMVVESPFGFTYAPPDAAANTIFNTTVSGRGATDFFEIPEREPVRIKRGTTSITIDLTATKLAGNFTSGDYRAETTIRCE